jgi:predicted phosphodiesterase
VDHDGTDEACFYLGDGQHRTELEILTVEHAPDAGVAQYQVLVPNTAAEGLADLIIVQGGVCSINSRAVAVRACTAAGLRVVYTSDWHLLRMRDDGPPVDQSSMFFELVHHLNAMAPDVVIHTGDVITRYDEDKVVPLPEVEIRKQMDLARAIFDLLRVPVFVVPGNHDMASEMCRRIWWETVGRPWQRSTDDVSLVLGPCHFLLMDGFAHYDPTTHQITACSLTPSQLTWLEKAVAETEARWRVLALHYDYSRQILPRLQELGIDLFFYGHTNSSDLDFSEQSGVRNGHLPESLAYRLAEISADNLELGPPVDFAELGIEVAR